MSIGELLHVAVGVIVISILLSLVATHNNRMQVIDDHFKDIELLIT